MKERIKKLKENFKLGAEKGLEEGKYQAIELIKGYLELAEMYSYDHKEIQATKKIIFLCQKVIVQINAP